MSWRATAHADISEVILYDPTTGEFRWKVMTCPKFAVGSIAGCIDNDGYRMIGFRYRRIPAARLAWRIMTGAWPSRVVDHKNRDRSDDRWDNLRLATLSQNSCNRPVRNPALPRGACLYRDGRRYQAAIKDCGRTLYLGLHDSAEAAGRAYDTAAKALYGEFASLNYPEAA